jgi:N-acetyl-anhydromuramyl-L-alanine amidase AmpD
VARSREYPDLPFIEPRAWNSGRAAGQPSVIVIHATDGSEGLTSAEDGAAYDARRTDGTSTHYFHDQDTTIQCVYTWDRANHAKGAGNRIGIAHELCGRGNQTAAQWHDAASLGTLRQAARQCARDAAKYGIPRRRLTPAQLRDGLKGFAGHVDISNAFHESDHEDPGTGFPWSEFLAMVEYEMEISPMNPADKADVRAIVTEVVDSRLDDIAAASARAVATFKVDVDRGPGTNLQQWQSVDAYGSGERHDIIDATTALRADVTALDAKLDAILARLPGNARS